MFPRQWENAAIMEETFSTRSMPRYYNRNQFAVEVTPCGGGVEYLHRDPASRRRRRKGKSRIWDSKICHESYGTRTRKWLRWRGPAGIVNDRPGLSSERSPQINKPETVVSPRWVLYSKQTGRLTVGRNIRLRLSCSQFENCWGSVVVSCCCDKLVAEAGDCSGTQRKENVRRWKPILSNGNEDVTAYTNVYVIVNCIVQSRPV
jgi:hypothetical protein